MLYHFASPGYLQPLLTAVDALIGGDAAPMLALALVQGYWRGADIARRIFSNASHGAADPLLH